MGLSENKRPGDRLNKGLLCSNGPLKSQIRGHLTKQKKDRLHAPHGREAEPTTQSSANIAQQGLCAGDMGKLYRMLVTSFFQ